MMESVYTKTTSKTANEERIGLTIIARPDAGNINYVPAEVVDILDHFEDRLRGSIPEEDDIAAILPEYKQIRNDKRLLAELLDFAKVKPGSVQILLLRMIGQLEKEEVFSQEYDFIMSQIAGADIRNQEEGLLIFIDLDNELEEDIAKDIRPLTPYNKELLDSIIAGA